MKKYIMVIDEGTTGTRALIFNKDFHVVAQSYEEFTQHTPDTDRVEHDAEEIFSKSIEMCKRAMEVGSINPKEIAAIGITNQRATCVIWDRYTGKPLHNAIVWQDNRTASLCKQINNSEWGEKARKATGWTVAPVYSSLMVKWFIENIPGIQEKIDKNEVLIGTIDTWLIWKLTGGKVHATSYSNGSVMGSLELSTGTWYKEFLDYLKVPIQIFPELINDSGDFGTTSEEIFGAEIPITSAIADQHAALYAQGCRMPGMAKCTNGTGSFVDINIGDKPIISDRGLNTVIAWKIGDQITYAVEGYAAVTGSAIQWLRDGLGIIHNSSETEAMANSVKDSDGVYFVPALAGLNAPYWDAFARGTIMGISRGTTKAHVARATLEAISYSIKDIFEAIEQDSGVKLTTIKIDGGASKNNFLAQNFADILDAEVERPLSLEATSLGAAQLAGLYAGFWSEGDFQHALAVDKTFKPQISEEKREKLYLQWKKAVERSMSWLE